MKWCVFVLSLSSFILLQQQSLVSGQEIEYANRKWFETNRTLYRIEVEAESKWKEAFSQCKKEKMNLIKLQPGSHPTDLQEFVKKIFREFPSFWAQNNATNTTFMQTIGFKLKRGRDQMCNKIDHKSFEIHAEKCVKQLGFICERSLKNAHSTHQIQRQLYYIEPQAKYSCAAAKKVCAKQNMTLLLSTSYIRDALLKDYIFLNYGSSPTFWFAGSNTSAVCLSLDRSASLIDGFEHGFICEKTVVKPFLTFRHLLLIACVSVAAFLAIIVFIACKCYFRRKVHEITATSQPEKK